MQRPCGMLLIVALVASAAAAADKPRVTFELITRPGLPATAPQQWHQALSELGLSGLRIRTGAGDDELSIENQGTGAAPSYKVMGILSADNVLYVPGGKFGLRDTGKLRKWLDTLRDEGAEGVTGERSAFGLLPRELQAVHDDLKRPVDFSTKGMPAGAALGQIAAGLGIPLAPDAGAMPAVAEVKVADELKGLARGTALAAILRPAGLVLQPRHERGGPLEYRVGQPQAGGEAWPVGWKPSKRASELLPALFEMLNVEIKETSVAEALVAIEGRLDAPFLFDRNAMALHGADPAGAQADVPAKRMSYSQVLRKVLSQAKLKYELRVDEADKPFLWITTVKPAP